jgi:hypothetical protein
MVCVALLALLVGCGSGTDYPGGGGGYGGGGGGGGARLQDPCVRAEMPFDDNLLDGEACNSFGYGTCKGFASDCVNYCAFDVCQPGECSSDADCAWLGQGVPCETFTNDDGDSLGRWCNVENRSSGGGSGGGGSGGGSCSSSGSPCQSESDCCSGSHCVNYDFGSYCGDECTSASGCKSSCCVKVKDQYYSVCAPDYYCS